jgi:hypothetical protein
MTVIGYQPCRVGQHVVGCCRVGVYKPQWERVLERFAREIVWRVANFNVDRNATTGHRLPDYTLTHTIYAVYEEQGGSLLPLPSGYVQTADAVLTCMDGVKELDQIYLPVEKKYFEVQHVKDIYSYDKGQDVTDFQFRVCDLHLLSLYAE